MNYGFYRDRKPGDRVVDRTGRVGVVSEIYAPHTGRDAIAVTWEDGTMARNLMVPAQFRLLSCVLTKAGAGKIPRLKLAAMLKARGISTAER